MPSPSCRLSSIVLARRGRVCLCGMGVPGSNGSTFLFTFWTQGGTTEGAYTSAEAETVVDSEKKLGMSCAGPGMQL